MATKILIPDGLSRAGIEYLRQQGDWSVLGPADLAGERFVHELVDADALVVRSKSKVTAQFLALAERLRVIGRAGAGVDNIDVEACTARGILVMNTPGGNSVSAAEHTLALILALARNVPQANASLKAGNWSRAEFEGMELRGKTLGIVGVGKIGIEVARRARGLGMQVRAYDPYVAERLAKDAGLLLGSLEEVLATADILTLHAPLNQSTRNMINDERLRSVKPGALLVNCARGELVDDNALLQALTDGRLRGAALDVYAAEPPVDFRIIRLPNVIATPHIAASTREAQESVGQEISRTVAAYLSRGIIQNAINFPSVSQEEYLRLKPFIDLGQKLGAFISRISSGPIEHLGIRYYGTLAEMDTAHISSAVICGALRPILSDTITPVNARLAAAGRGIETVESKSSRVRRYSNMISVKLRTRQREEWVEGTVVQPDKHRICAVDGIHVEAPLEGTVLFYRNHDKPGVIGQVGTLLGDNRINIANFALGRNATTAQAVAVVNVDESKIGDEILLRLRAFPAIDYAQAINL